MYILGIGLILAYRMADVTLLVWAYKHTREIARRLPLFRGEPPSLHPQFPEGSKAAAVPEADGPFPMDAERIVYTNEDNNAIEQFIRATGTSSSLPSTGK